MGAFDELRILVAGVLLVATIVAMTLGYFGVFTPTN